MSHTAVQLRDFVRDIPDFPKLGIVFKDVTPMLADGDAFSACVAELACFIPEGTDTIVGIESRGFLFGAALAQLTGLGFVPVRKPGKLPADVHAVDYELEYGMDRLEIHRDALANGQKLVIVDDLLATGGTAEATVKLVRDLGAEVTACLFAIELSFLSGRERLQGIQVAHVLEYDA